MQVQNRNNVCFTARNISYSRYSSTVPIRQELFQEVLELMHHKDILTGDSYEMKRQIKKTRMIGITPLDPKTKKSRGDVWRIILDSLSIDREKTASAYGKITQLSRNERINDVASKVRAAVDDIKRCLARQAQSATVTKLHVKPAPSATNPPKKGEQLDLFRWIRK